MNVGGCHLSLFFGTSQQMLENISTFPVIALSPSSLFHRSGALEFPLVFCFLFAFFLFSFDFVWDFFFSYQLSCQDYPFFPHIVSRSFPWETYSLKGNYIQCLHHSPPTFFLNHCYCCGNTLEKCIFSGFIFKCYYYNFSFYAWTFCLFFFLSWKI